MSGASPAADDGPLHRIDARAKLLACLGIAVIGVTLPSSDHRGLAGMGALVLLLILAARLRPAALARRLLVLAPFLAIAALMPFARPASGLDQAVGESAKAVIGCLALVVLAATTPVERLLAGLAGLRCPAVVVLLLSVQIRYLQVLRDEAGRMRRAATARGYAPRSLAQVAALGGLVGALFLRSHARAERVHLAMAARGFTGDAVAEDASPMRTADWTFLAATLGTAIAWRLLRA